MRLLQNECKNVRGISILEEELPYKKEDILETMIYERKIAEIKETKLDELKRSILNDVLLWDVDIKEFAEANNITVKDVYNHIYLLRCKLKDKY